MTASPDAAWPLKNRCWFRGGSCTTTSAAAGNTAVAPSFIQTALRPPKVPLRGGSPAYPWTCSSHKFDSGASAGARSAPSGAKTVDLHLA